MNQDDSLMEEDMPEFCSENIVIYNALTDMYYSKVEYRKAIECAELSLINAKEIGDKENEGIAYGNLGMAYESLSEYQTSIKYHKESLRIAEEIGDKRHISRAYGNLGMPYCCLGEYQTAITYYKNSVEIAVDIGDKKLMGFCYRNLGNAFHLKGEFQASITYHKMSLDIAQDIEDKQEQGNAHGNLGVNYRSLGEYRKAIESHKKCLDFAREIEDKHLEANSYGNIGSCYCLLGEFRESIKWQEKSLGIVKEIGNKAGEGMVCGNLGTVYESLGEYHKANAYYEESLRIAKEIGNKKLVGNSYGNIANIYALTGNYHKAIEYDKMRLSIAEEIGDSEGKGRTYAHLGSTYQALNNFHEAVECFKNGLIIFVQIGDKEVEGSCYGGIGNAYQALKRHRESLEYYTKELEIAEQIGSKQMKMHVYGHIGNAYDSLKDFQRSLEYQVKSLKVASEIGDRRVEGLAHHNIGSLYCRSDSEFKNLSKAEEHLKSSLECYEKLFDDLKDKDQFKISFLDTYVITIKLLTDVRLQTGQPEEALLVCERGRACALRDVLRMKCKTTEISGSKQKLLNLDDLKSISSSMESCILFYDLHRNNMTTRLWVLAPTSKPIYIPQVADFKALETNKSDNEISDGYFNYLVKNSFTDLNVRKGLICEDRSQGPLDHDVDAEERWLKDESDESNVKPLEMLFDMLISPALSKLTQEEIVIIPDGPLFKVPFAAMKVPNTGEFLSETKRIRLAPSLTTLKLLQESSDDVYNKSDALIIGDPLVGEVMYRGEKRTDIPSLPGARAEAIDIGKLLGIQPLIGNQATKEEVLRRLRHGVCVVHFAAHGSAKNGEIMLSPALPATKGTTPEEKDYMLTMKEAQESGIRAQLVVLSCCHSGRGEIKSEGVVGMARAFLAAGARAVVASLWAIDDQATRLFMLKFYSHLKNGESASRSLQQAMKDIRERDMYKEPKYWAAFFLIGDDVTITVLKNMNTERSTTEPKIAKKRKGVAREEEKTYKERPIVPSSSKCNEAAGDIE